MLWSEQESYTTPFPRIPESIRARHSIGDLSIRRFGIFEKDLEISFSVRSRPYLASKILKCCSLDNNGDSPEIDFFLDLPVGKRIECLLTLANLGGSFLLGFSTLCQNGACNLSMEIEISIDELLTLEGEYEDSDSCIVHIGDRRALMRKPNGYDQLEWLKNSYPDEDEAIREMIYALLSGNEELVKDRKPLFSDEFVQIINDSMDEFDPLVNFNLTACCPYCGKEGRYDVDLEKISLERLEDAQTRLIGSVHRLAKHYHWSEKQFFSIPPWRRSHYLALIEYEENS